MGTDVLFGRYLITSGARPASLAIFFAAMAGSVLWSSRQVMPSAPHYRTPARVVWRAGPMLYAMAVWRGWYLGTFRTLRKNSSSFFF